jgi:23S rRNA-/tRNA-specific pseudouridylate synthase
VHLAFIGCPVVGDQVYGFRKQRMKKLFLHAARISFDQPTSGKRLTIEAPLPPALVDILNKLPK